MKLSIITINRNNVEGLRRTIESVMSQSSLLNVDYEYIVVDGASNDGSRDLLSLYSDSITRSVSEPDTGIYNAMNKGVAMSTGEYCLFLNSADVLMDASIVRNSIQYLDGTDIICATMLTSDRSEFRSPDNRPDLFYFYQGLSLPHESTFIKKTLLVENPYDETYRIVSDWKFFFTSLVFKGASYKSIPIVVSVFDLTGISSTNHELLNNETQAVISDLLPTWLIDDLNCRISNKTIEESLYEDINNSRCRRHIYRLNLMVLRIASIFYKNVRWVRKYSYVEK